MPSIVGEDANSYQVDDGSGTVRTVAKTGSPYLNGLPRSQEISPEIANAATLPPYDPSAPKATDDPPSGPVGGQIFSGGAGFGQMASDISKGLLNSQYGAPPSADQAGQPGAAIASNGDIPAGALPKGAGVAGAQSALNVEGGGSSASAPGGLPAGGGTGAPGDQFSKAYAAQRAAIKQSTDVGTLIGAEQAAAADELSKAAQKRQDDLKVEQAERQKYLDEAENKRQEAADAEKKFKFQDYWADKSTGAKIGAALAMAFGAYSSSINGGPNAAMQIIDGAVKRDIDLQQRKYEQLKDSSKNADSAYGRLYQRLGDKQLASTQAYISSLEMIRAKGAASVARLYGQDAKAKGAVALADLDSHIADKRAEYGLKAQELGIKTRTAQMGMMENYIPELGIMATSKEGAAKVNSSVAIARKSQGNIAQLLSIANESGKSLNPETRAKAQIAATMLLGELKKNYNDGSPRANPKELEMLEGIVKNPTSIFSFDSVNKSALTNLSNNLEQGVRLEAKSYAVPQGGGMGASPLQTGMVNMRVPKQGGGWRYGAVPADKVQTNLNLGGEVVR